MPELPEVQTVRRFLQKALLQPKPKTIKSIKLYYEPIVKQPSPQSFQKLLIGQNFTQIGRYGKFLLLKLDSHTIISHLRMQGKYAFYTQFMKKNQGSTIPNKILLKQQDQQSKLSRTRSTNSTKKNLLKQNDEIQKSSSSFSIGKHDHVQFQMTDGSSLVFSDVRKFGTMHLVKKGEQMKHKSLVKLGPQVNKPQFTLEYLKQVCQNKQTTIKELLLKQQIVCGIGNIYADQILYAAETHPETQCTKLSEHKLEKIVKQSKRIIDAAIQNKGTTFRSFSSNNQEGSNQNFLSVYGKVGQNCKKCNGKIQKIVVGQRGTHFCPKCQHKN